MSQINNLIISAVRNAGHWGVLRNNIISADVHERMAELVGMKTSGTYMFRYQFFADGVKELNPKAMLALSTMFDIDRQKLEALNKELSEK